MRSDNVTDTGSGLKKNRKDGPSGALRGFLVRSGGGQNTKYLPTKNHNLCLNKNNQIPGG